MKAILALALAVLPLSANVQPTLRPASTQEGIPAADYPEIVRIDCLTGSGSGFMVGPHIGLSANHVTSLQGCFINDTPLKVVSHAGDFSIFETPDAARKWLTIDCGGYEAHRRYEALGYAHGLDSLTEVDIHATGHSASVNGEIMAILEGVFNVIPGMSGGTIMDPDTHRAVGVVNTFNAEAGLSGSVALKDTTVCRGAVA